MLGLNGKRTLEKAQSPIENSVQRRSVTVTSCQGETDADDFGRNVKALDPGAWIVAYAKRATHVDQRD